MKHGQYSNELGFDEVEDAEREALHHPAANATMYGWASFRKAPDPIEGALKLGQEFVPEPGTPFLVPREGLRQIKLSAGLEPTFALIHWQ